jgi:hypothetical protein
MLKGSYMAKAVDLDAFVSSNITVTLDGKEYTLPGDLPMEIYLRVNQASDMEDESESKALSLLVDTLVDLFTILAPEDRKPQIQSDVSSVLQRRGVMFSMQLMRHIYGADEEVAADEASEDSADPTPAQETGTTNTTN